MTGVGTFLPFAALHQHGRRTRRISAGSIDYFLTAVDYRRNTRHRPLASRASVVDREPRRGQRRFFSRPRRRHVAPRFRERSSDAARCPSAVVGYRVFNLIPSVRVLDCEPVRSRLARPLPQDYDHLPLGGTQIIVHISPHRLSICLWGRSAVDDRLRPRSGFQRPVSTRTLAYGSRASCTRRPA